MNQNSNDLIDCNYTNYLITQLSSNGNSDLIIHNKNTRWLEIVMGLKIYFESFLINNYLLS